MKERYNKGGGLVSTSEVEGLGNLGTVLPYVHIKKNLFIIIFVVAIMNISLL